MGFNSGLRAGNIIMQVCCWKKSVINLAVWAWALTYWNTWFRWRLKYDTNLVDVACGCYSTVPALVVLLEDHRSMFMVVIDEMLQSISPCVITFLPARTPLSSAICQRNAITTFISEDYSSEQLISQVLMFLSPLQAGTSMTIGEVRDPSRTSTK